MKDRDKSSEVFKSTQKSNNKADDYYDAMHKDSLIMKQDILNPIAFAGSNNADILYYHQYTKAPDTN